MKKNIFNFGWGIITVQWNEASPESETEMLCYDSIGKDPWSGNGLSADDFIKALNDCPKDRDINMRVNSRGGDVHHGTAIQNSITNWKNQTGRKFNTTIDGVAASTASWAFPCASDEVRAYKSSQIFVHDPFASPTGNAEDLRKVANYLDQTGDQIAGMYADQAGGSRKSWRDKMRDETLMTGTDAMDCGLVDKLINGDAVRNFTPKDIVNMSNHLAALYNSVAQQRGGEPQQKNTMNKTKIIQVLNAAGVKEWEGKPITAETSDEHLEAALKSVLNKQIEAATAAVAQPAAGATASVDPAATMSNAELTQMREQLKMLNELAVAQREIRLKGMLNTLVTEDRISQSEVEKALVRAMKDETYIDELKTRPQRPVGSPALKPLAEVIGNSFNEIQGFCLENGPRFMKNFIGAKAEGHIGKHACEEIKTRALAVANTISKHKQMLIEMFDANTIDAGLQRQIILQEMIEEFAIVITPITAFSTVFRNVPLEGTDQVEVPFYPLAVDAGNSWSAATGYAANLMGGTVTNTRQITVGGSGNNSGANAPAGTAQDRKFIGALFSSYELARQPYLNVQKLMIQKTNRLAVLIFQDIVSRVITAANFGASIDAVAAAQFSPDDIANLWENATGRNWPDRGRTLILNHTYKTPLLKDVTFKQYLAYGSTDPLRKAQIQEAYGFEDIITVPNLATYSPAGENLVGWINHMYAALVAFAPIMPTPEVRALMTNYDVVVEPKSGCSFEYRRFGNVITDQTNEVVESSYGASYGVQSALARITSQ